MQDGKAAYSKALGRDGALTSSRHIPFRGGLWRDAHDAEEQHSDGIDRDDGRNWSEEDEPARPSDLVRSVSADHDDEALEDEHMMAGAILN